MIKRIKNNDATQTLRPAPYTLTLKEDPILIRNASQLITLSGPKRPRSGKEMGRLGLIEKGSLLIRDGIISDIYCKDPSSRIGKCKILEAEGKVIMPGFVDSHTHPLFASPRIEEYEMRIKGATYDEIARSGGGIKNSVKRLRDASDEILYQNLKGFIEKFIRYGTTTIEAKSGYGLDLDNEIRMLKIFRRVSGEGPIDIIPTFLGAHAVPDEYLEDREGYIRLIINEMLPVIEREKLAVFCDVFCEKGYFTPHESSRILKEANKAGLKLKIHADQLSDSSGAMVAAELKAVSADHLDFLSDKSLKALKNAGVIATLLPGPIFHLGLKRYPPARMLIESGIPVALATDFNPGTSPTLNMQMITSLACTQMHMTPAEAITAATINAAYAIDMGDKIGSLEPGKQADIIIMDVPDYRLIPYYYGMNHCGMVIKKGKILSSSPQIS
ncbi:MAG: imidazolonepropionase [Nitrospirota bacterium]